MAKVYKDVLIQVTCLAPTGKEMHLDYTCPLDEPDPPTMSLHTWLSGKVLDISTEDIMAISPQVCFHCHATGKNPMGMMISSLKKAVPKFYFFNFYTCWKEACLDAAEAKIKAKVDKTIEKEMAEKEDNLTGMVCVRCKKADVPAGCEDGKEQGSQTKRICLNNLMEG